MRTPCPFPLVADFEDDFDDFYNDDDDDDADTDDDVYDQLAKVKKSDEGNEEDEEKGLYSFLLRYLLEINNWRRMEKNGKVLS